MEAVKQKTAATVNRTPAQPLLAQRSAAAAARVQPPSVRVAGPRIQPSSLRVSQPSDPAEKEAESTAKAVVRMSIPDRAVAFVRTAAGGVFRRITGKDKEKEEELAAGKRDPRKWQSPHVARFAGTGLFRKPDEVRRKAEGTPNVGANVAAEIQAASSGGNPLPLGVRRFMEPRFKADFSKVRVHTGDRAAKLNRQVNAKAFAVGGNVFFGKGQFQPETGEGRELIAHELTHTIQQGAAVQRSEDVAVTQQSAVQVQRLGVSDVLDYFADKANLIPGFRMLTIVLGVNPVNMSRVDRSAANIMRAIVEFIPGGGLITKALDAYGVFDKVGGWVEQQIASLGMTGAAFKAAITEFLDSLSWTDIFDLGGVWQRAKRIFSAPVDRLIAFAANLIGGILQFIQDAILRPLAGLAQGTRGYPLLTAILGRDPITGDPVPRTAETLIGGFMKLIGQEEVWENIKKGNAIARAWEWFQGALSGLMSQVQAVPGKFIAMVKSLTLADIVVLPRAFAKVAGVFLDIIGGFLGWAGGQVMKLLEIVFDVVSPGAMGYIKKVGASLLSILKNPLPFVGNLVKAAKLGFQNFAGRFGTHLKAGLIDWLVGSLPGIYIPKAFTLGELVKFVFSVLGLTWANVRGKLVKAVGETAVKAMEAGFVIVTTLVTKGPAAAWEQIKQQLGDLQTMIVGGITDLVIDAVVTKGIPKLIAMFIPGAGFISAILSIYDTVMVFVNKISKIIQVVTGFINSIVAIAAGQVGAAAAKVESVLAGLLALAINFLAGFAGLGKVADKVMGVVAKIRAPIDKALDALIGWIVGMARKLGRYVAQAGVPNDPNERLRLATRDATAAARRLSGRVTGSLLAPVLSGLKVRYGLTDLRPMQRGGSWWVVASINPTLEQNLGVPSGEGAAGAGVPEVRVPVTMDGAQHTLSIGGARGATLVLASAAGPLVQKVDAAIAAYSASAGANPDRTRLAAMQGIRAAAVRVEAAEAGATGGRSLDELRGRLGELGSLIGAYASRFKVKDLDASNPINDVALVVQQAQQAADATRLAPISMATILLQIERVMGPAWTTFMAEFTNRIYTLTEASLIAVYGPKRGREMADAPDSVLQGNGLYDPKRDVLFVRASRSLTEISASVVHEGTHSLQTRFGLQLSRYAKEYQAFSVQRQFLQRVGHAAFAAIPPPYDKLAQSASDADLHAFVQSMYAFVPEPALTQAANVAFIKNLVRTKFRQA